MERNGQPRSAQGQPPKAEGKAPKAGDKGRHEFAQEGGSAKERGPMGKRLDRLCSLTSRKRDLEARRRAILNTTIDVIVEKGATALTHRVIAAHTGVSLGSTTEYFSSIENPRENVVDTLVRKMGAGVGVLESELEACDDVESYCIGFAYEYLRDARQVKADVALFNVDARDDGLREITLRNPDRLIAAPVPHFGVERAMALEPYLEGAAIHSVLRSTSIDKEVIERIFRGIISAPRPGQTEAHERRVL